MSEEAVVDPDKLELAPVEESAEQSDPDPAEEKARQDGWVPLDEWAGDPGDWVDAKQFNLKGELYGRIKKQSKFINDMKSEVTDLKEAIKEMREHSKKVVEQERAQMLKELKKERREAMEASDYDAVDELEEKMDELKALDLDDEPEPETPQQQGPDPEVIAWLDDNQWYSEDRVARGAFEQIVAGMVEEDPSVEQDPTQLLNDAFDVLKKELPSKFNASDDAEEEEETPAPRKRSSVSEPSQRGRTKASTTKVKYSKKDLNDQQLRFGQTFVESGAFKSLDEYAAELATLGELDSQK